MCRGEQHGEVSRREHLQCLQPGELCSATVGKLHFVRDRQKLEDSRWKLHGMCSWIVRCKYWDSGGMHGVCGGVVRIEAGLNEL